MSGRQPMLAERVERAAPRGLCPCCHTVRDFNPRGKSVLPGALPMVATQSPAGFLRKRRTVGNRLVTSPRRGVTLPFPIFRFAAADS